MPACARVHNDIAGGIILGQLSKTVFVNNQPIAVLNDLAQDHGKHKHPIITSASSTVFADGHQVARLHDHVSCGCTITSGSSGVSIG